MLSINPSIHLLSASFAANCPGLSWTGSWAFLMGGHWEERPGLGMPTRPSLNRDQPSSRSHTHRTSGPQHLPGCPPKARRQAPRASQVLGVQPAQRPSGSRVI